jgi:ABC-type transport system involved in cytochrome c biogenesis permease subunit
MIRTGSGFPSSDERAPARKPWFAMAATTVGLAGLLIFAEGQLSGVGGVVASRLSVHASLLSTLLLALSAVLYLAHTLVRDPSVGRAASAFAGAGASGVIGASLVRWVEVEWMAPGTLDYAGQYESLTWLAAITVYIYLCIEDIYETRLAGGVVLPSVVAALGLAAWLIAVSPAPETTFMALAAAYIGEGTRVSTMVGIGALGVTGALGIAGLVRPWAVAVGPGSAWRRWPLRGPPAYERTLRRAMLVGFCAFTLAVMLGAARQLVTRAPEFDPSLPALWLDFAALFLAWRLRRARRDLLSWGSLIAIALLVIGLVAPRVMAQVAGIPS